MNHGELMNFANLFVTVNYQSAFRFDFDRYHVDVLVPLQSVALVVVVADVVVAVADVVADVVVFGGIVEINKKFVCFVYFLFPCLCRYSS